MDCLFCKINKNEMDSLTIYEDDVVRVILDAYPDANGHTLIIPKSILLIWMKWIMKLYHISMMLLKK